MAKKASEHIRYYENPKGPVIGTVSRQVIEKDGLYFKDLDGSGQFQPYDDWRLPAEERARAYVKALTVDEKIAQLFISDWRMGKYLSQFPEHTPRLDESGVLDDAEFRGKTIFGEQNLPGTTELIQKWFARHLILRANPTPEDLTDWINQLHAVAEECEHFVPVQVVSNSRNENGELVFGMNDAAGVFAAWPGTMGIAAAVKGDSIDLVDEFADCVRREWDAVGLKKGYMYMADVVSDPRWQRTYGTFGEDPELICEIFKHLIPGIQGSREGVTPDGVAMTVKHFPGGGARENGFDPHYQMGQWNVYQTEGSLEKYHIPGFQVAADYMAASIMPYYARPAKAKSAPQTDKNGEAMEMKPYGFAYNKPFIDGLLRRQMGFQGYINSDTGIVHNMSWGVEMLDKPERIGFAVNNAGVDLISGLFDNVFGREAYDRASNDYYENNPVPEGFTKEELILTDEVLDRAVARTLTEMFRLGMFENPYRDPKKAAEVIGDQADWEAAMEVHRKSVVLLKNSGALPLTADKLAGKKVYARCFAKNPETAKAATQSLRGQIKGDVTLTEDYREADYAVLLLNPSSGEYFNATPGYLELDLCDGKAVPDVDGEGRPADSTHLETTLSGVDEIREIAEAVHGRGGKVIASVNVTLAWEVGNVEPYCDGFLAGFDTYASAVLDVILGRFSPTGKLPITLPRGDQVLRVNPDGVCVSPNDVPGFDKDLYMPEELKDENGKAYAYRDGAGNYYEMNFGLNY
ncbi:MAG: glycoside hydrolase family 3 N-terminal domain-containing protein [Lachnospiraceae bacterium]|nr:glycoside hydrolase family 3 N-terminal domain-containing protein [Lachnospiraceae bacterium]